MNNKERIGLNDTMMSAVAKLADGNPGAAQALMSLSINAAKIDPQSFGGALGPLLSFDSHGIYGTDIYILWSDICNKNASKTLAVLRAVQLGMFDERTLKDACSRQDYSGREMIPVDDLYEKVCEKLEDFDKIEQEL
jgi:hypothetical protein